MTTFFTNLCKSLQRVAGFTMIELLVVGVLAVAVLSSINPIEQINKGRDTRLRSDAGQMLSAVERYFAIHELYPWNEARTGTNPYTPTSTLYSAAFSFDGPTAGATSPQWNWTYQLSDTQEVKPAFTARVIADSRIVVLREVGDNSSTYVCFSPSSYAFRLEAAKNCNTSGGGAQVATINGFTVCNTTNGTIPASGSPQNFICLP
jgi:type II secretory pathway pseudopilin PulG